MATFQDYALLSTYQLSKETTYAYPERKRKVVSLDTPAYEVLTDFKKNQPEKISKTKLAKEALTQMQSKGVKSLLVTDDEGKVLGGISSQYVQSLKLTQAAQTYDVKPNEVTVEMIMKPVYELAMLKYEELKNVRVGHIARLLYEKNLQHVHVFQENEDRSNVLRGVFSASRISDQLGMAIGRKNTSESIAEMNKII